MYKNDKLEAFVQRRIAAAKKPRSPMQAMIIDMFKRHWMNGIVYSVIVVNVVGVLMMLTPSIEIDLVLMQNLEIINYTCSVIFILEMLVKFYAYGFFGYWREPLNCLIDHTIALRSGRYVTVPMLALKLGESTSCGTGMMIST